MTLTILRNREIMSQDYLLQILPVTTILNVLPTLNPVSRNQLNSPVERSELHASNTIEVEILPTISIVTESSTILRGWKQQGSKCNQTFL